MQRTFLGNNKVVSIVNVVFNALDKVPPGQATEVLTDGGVYLNVDAALDKIKTRDVVSLLHDLKELVEAGKVRAAIDERYPLEEIVEAHRYVDKDRKKGNVAVIIIPDPTT